MTAAPSLAQSIFYFYFSKQLKKVFSKLSGTPEKINFFYSNNPRKFWITFIFI